MPAPQFPPGSGGPEAAKLKQQITELQAQVASEQSQSAAFERSVAELQDYSTASQTQREQLKAQLRATLLQKQSLEEKCTHALTIYKAKIKHLLAEHQQLSTSQRIAHETSHVARDDAQRAAQHSDAESVRAVKHRLLADSSAAAQLHTAQRAAQETDVGTLRRHYEQATQQLVAAFDAQSRAIRDAADESRQVEIERLEQQKNARIAELRARHEQRFVKIKSYFGSIMQSNLELIRQLKRQVAECKSADSQVTQEVNEIRSVNKKLSEPLKVNLTQIAQLKQQLAQYAVDQREMKRVTAELHRLTQLHRDTEWSCELLRQRTQHTHLALTQLQHALNETVFSNQQKASFAKGVQARQVRQLQLDLEKTDAALIEILKSTPLQHQVTKSLTRDLESLLIDKNKQIMALEDDCERLRRRQEQTVLHYKKQMSAFGVDRQAEALGFQPKV